MEGMNYIIYSNEHGTVRVELIDGKEWYFAADICRLLYADSKHTSYRMQKVAEENKLLVERPTKSGTRKVYMINSKGFAALASTSECSAERTEELVNLLIAAREEAKKHQKLMSKEVKACERVEPEQVEKAQEAEDAQTTVIDDNLTIFNSREFGDIRTVLIDGTVWFVGRDVALALGYVKPENALQTHVDSEDKTTTLIQGNGSNYKSKTTLINESGLYGLILCSKLASAKRFKRWVTSEVLPQIRKTGSYKQPEPQKPLTQLEMMRIQLGMIDSHEERIKTLEDTMTIDYGQQETLANTVSRTVITALGGKESNAYKEVARKVFAECNHDLKTYFNVNARNNVPRKRFDEAVEYAQSWKPCMNTQMMIRDCNAQMSF